jgi:hypothetical protein
MAVQEVTLHLPDVLYEQIKHAAEKARRTLDDVLLDAIAAIAPGAGGTPHGLQAALAQMAYLSLSII